MKAIMSALIFFSGISFALLVVLTRHIGFLNRQINRTEAVVDSFRVEEQKIAWMQKTLMVTYPNVSKYEAKYYAYVFRDFATQYNIDWCVYPAKIRIESNFNPTLVSNKGARGLCQILEGTAKEQADKLGIQYVCGITEWNEINNIVMGCNYLSEGIKDSGIEFGLRRYYSGSGKNKSVDVTGYYTTVFSEYQKIGYIYKGIRAEQK